MKHIALLGDGAWGTAIATALAHNGHRVKIWCYNPELVGQITHEHLNKKYLPGITLSPLITAHDSLEHVIDDATVIFQAIPVKYMRSVLMELKKKMTVGLPWVTLSKGIEQDSLMLPADIIKAIFGASSMVAAVSGPSFARDVAQKQRTGMIVAAEDPSLSKQVMELLSSDYISLQSSSDLRGVQLCGALKNVMTLALTMLEGAGYSETTRAFILITCLQEMEMLVHTVGGRKETVYGLAGIGDLVLTAYSNQSKNAQVGRRIGQGESVDEILAQTGYIPEGINTVAAIIQLADRHKCAVPLCRGVYAIISGEKNSKQFLREIVG